MSPLVCERPPSRTAHDRIVAGPRTTTGRRRFVSRDHDLSDRSAVRSRPDLPSGRPRGGSGGEHGGAVGGPRAGRRVRGGHGHRAGSTVRRARCPSRGAPGAARPPTGGSRPGHAREPVPGIRRGPDLGRRADDRHAVGLPRPPERRRLSAGADAHPGVLRDAAAVRADRSSARYRAQRSQHTARLPVRRLPRRRPWKA